MRRLHACAADAFGAAPVSALSRSPNNTNAGLHRCDRRRRREVAPARHVGRSEGTRGRLRDGAGGREIARRGGIGGRREKGGRENDFAGAAASVTGDINGDGKNDVVIGAYGANNGDFTGKVYVIMSEL